MKSSLDQLTKQDRETLAHLYETEDWKVLRKLIDIERLELAKDHVDESDINQIRYLSGGAASLKKLVGTVHENFKKLNKPQEG